MKQLEPGVVVQMEGVDCARAYAWFGLSAEHREVSALDPGLVEGDAWRLESLLLRACVRLDLANYLHAKRELKEVVVKDAIRAPAEDENSVILLIEGH